MSKKKSNKKQFSIRLEVDDYEKLVDYCWKNRKSLNDGVTESVKQYLDNIESKADARR